MNNYNDFPCMDDCSIDGHGNTKWDRETNCFELQSSGNFKVDENKKKCLEESIKRGNDLVANIANSI